jgi:thioredoxin 1
MIEVNNNNFDDTVLKSNQLVIVDLWAEWCGPCRIITPILEELSRQYMKKLVVSKCNVDENPSIAARYGIKSIPTVLYFKGGTLVSTQVGSAPKASYEKKIISLL